MGPLSAAPGTQPPKMSESDSTTCELVSSSERAMSPSSSTDEIVAIGRTQCRPTPIVAISCLL